MVCMSTSNTTKTFPVSRPRVNVGAGEARLRTVGSGHLDNLATGPGHLIPQHLRKLGPRRPGNAPGEAVILQHPLHIQLFDHDRTVALGVGRGKLMKHMVALPPHRLVKRGHASLGLVSILGPLLSAGHGALRTRQTGERLLKMLRVEDEPAIGVGEEVRYPSVDGDHRRSPAGGFPDFHSTDNRDVPLSTVTAQCACLGFAFKGTVEHNGDVAELGEADCSGVHVDPPHLRVRLAKPEEVPAPPLPPGKSGRSLEAALERLVEFGEELRADVPRHVGKPRERRAEFRQLADLVKRSRVPLIGAAQPKEPLFEGEVPQKPQGRLPLRNPLDLLGRRVDAVAKCLAHEHPCSIALVYAAVKRFSYRPPRCFQTPYTLGLCPKVQAEGYIGRGLFGPVRRVAEGVHRLREPAFGGRLRAGPCAFACGISPQGLALHTGQLVKGRLFTATASDSVAGSRDKAAGRSLLVAVLLRGIVRGRTPRNRQAICRTTTRRGFLPALNGGVSTWRFR